MGATEGPNAMERRERPAKDQTNLTRKGLEVWSLGIKKKKGSINLTEEGAMEILTTNLNDHSQ